LARYTDSSCRLCRRENLKLFLKGDRCYSDKCAFERRPYAPGQHGQRRGGKVSDYQLQLREKQKLKEYTAFWKGSLENTIIMLKGKKVSLVQIFCFFLNAGLIMLFTGWVLHLQGVRQGNWLDRIILQLMAKR